MATSPTSRDGKRDARIAGVFFTVAAAILAVLLALDARDGQIWVGGNRGGRAQLIVAEADRKSFVLHVAWLAGLIGAVGAAGAGATVWSFTRKRESELPAPPRTVSARERSVSPHHREGSRP
jgi:hypothetical protein